MGGGEPGQIDEDWLLDRTRMREKTLFHWTSIFPRSPEPDPARMRMQQAAKDAKSGPREADEDDEKEVPKPVTEDEIKRNAKFQAMLKLQADAEDKEKKKDKKNKKDKEDKQDKEDEEE